MGRIGGPPGGDRTQARGRPCQTARRGRRPSRILAVLWLLLAGLGLVLPHDRVYAQSTISFETVATLTVGGANNITISKPTGTAQNDLLIAVVSTDGSPTISPPGGWTEIDQGQCASSQCTLGVWRLAAGASEPSSYNFTWSGGQDAAGAILRYSNTHVESNVVDIFGSATGTDTAPTAPSVTTTVANTLVLRVMSNDHLDLDPAAVPGGTTGRFALETSGAGSVGGAGADAQQASIGATGTAAFTLDATEEWRAVTVAFKPLQTATIVADQAMTEENLDARSLTLTLADTAFIDSTLLTSNFTLNNAPTGTTVESVTHNTSTNATVALAFTGADFDVDVTTFSVTTLTAELTGGSDVASNTLSITATVETSAIVADQAMTEENLDARSLTLTLTGATFADATLATGNFTLNNAPTGATVESVTHNSSTNATVALAFTGADFDADVTTFSVTVAAVELTNGGAITTSTLTITATVETVGLVADQPLTEENLDARSLTLTLSNATFAELDAVDRQRHAQQRAHRHDAGERDA